MDSHQLDEFNQMKQDVKTAKTAILLVTAALNTQQNINEATTNVLEKMTGILERVSAHVDAAEAAD